jgi:ribosome-associated protein
VADLVITPRLTIPAAELSVAFARSGGPGGQNVNKVSSKVDLRWNPRTSAAVSEADRAWLLTRLGNRLTADGTLIVISTLTRDQLQNRDDAEQKMVALIRTALARPKVRRPTKPTRGSKERRISEKKRRGDVKRGRQGGD